MRITALFCACQGVRLERLGVSCNTLSSVGRIACADEAPGNALTRPPSRPRCFSACPSRIHHRTYTAHTLRSLATAADGHPQHECAGARQVRWVTSPPRLPTMKEIERDRRELGAEFVDSHMRRIVQRRSQRRAKAAARPSSDGGARASSPPTAPLTSSASGDDHRKGEQQPSLFALAFKS